MRKIIMIWILALIIVAMPVLSQKTEEYGYGHKKVCSDGKCSLALYSGTQFVFEDGRWKHYKEARSLMDRYTLEYDKYDGIHDIKLISLNYTDVEFELQVKEESALNKDIPFKIDDTQVMKKRLQRINEKPRVKIKKENTLDSNYTFGFNSTTISLHDADTEVHEDGSVLSSTPDSKQGGSTELQTIGQSNWRKYYITFSIQQLPVDSIILNATLRLRNIRTDVTFIKDLHHVYTNNTAGSNMSEDHLTWNNQPCGVPTIDFQSETSWTNNATCNATAMDSTSVSTTTFYLWDMTTAVKSTYGDGLDNVSVVMNVLSNDGNSNYEASKEHATVDFRPQLNITFLSDPLDNNVSTSVLMLLNSTHANKTIFNDEGINASYLEVNGTANFTVNGNAILNNSFQNLSVGVHEFLAIIFRNDSVRGSNSTLFLTVVPTPKVPLGEKFTVANCSLDTIPKVLLFSLLFILAFSIIAVGKIFKAGLVGVFGALMLFVMSWYLYFCIFLVAAFLTGASILIVFYFIFRGMDNAL